MRCTAALSICLAFLFAGCVERRPCPDPVPEVAAESSAHVYVSPADPFMPGPLSVRTIELAACERGAPVELLIHVPESAGTYAVVLFIHGFVLNNDSFGGILRHLASHGFVVVAPQMYAPGPLGAFMAPSNAEEVATAVRVLDWCDVHLDDVAGVDADTTKLGLAGHSRGGRAVFSLIARQPTRFAAIAGIDPVAGRGGGDPQAIPLDRPLDYSAPTLVLGAARAGRCAPAGANHVRFFAAAPSPAWHVVALEYGHGDMLDDTATDLGLVTAVCETNTDREAMRRLTAGLMVALFRGALQGDAAAYAFLEDATRMPARVEVEAK